MDIECKLKREGGTHVDIDKINYHFAPREDGAHVATVANEAHQDRFLGITEAYRVYRGKEKAPTASAPVAAPVSAPVLIGEPVPPPDNILLGSSVHPASFDIHGKTYSLGDVVALAQAGSGLDATEWNELEDDSRADLIDEQLDKLNADTNSDGEVEGGEDRAAAAAEYKAKFGKAPHGKWTAAKIREALAAA